MAEYIDRDAALIEIERREALMVGDKRVSVDAMKSFIKNRPAADVAPVVHARWIHSRYEDCSEQFELVKCSHCNHEAYAMAFYVRGGNYCPSCGAKMDGGDSDAAD